MSQCGYDEKFAEVLRKHGLSEPAPLEPKGLYRQVVVVDNVAYTAGHLPFDEQGKLVTGRLGDTLDVAQGKRAALLAGVGILVSLKNALGTLDRVERLVALKGLICSADDFAQQPAVLDGCSELMAEVFGRDNGIGVRAAIGTNALPLGAAVEIEAVFRLRS